MTDKPPLDQRSRRRLARTGIPQQIVRRDRSEQLTAALQPTAASPITTIPLETATASEPLTTAPTQPPTMSDSSDSDGDAPRAITASVTVPTFGGELAKRARPSTSSSGNSDEQEDKRIKLTYPALPTPSEYAKTRDPSPTNQPISQTCPLPTYPSASPRREASVLVTTPHIGPFTPPNLPSHSHDAESAMQLSRSHSAQSTVPHESASWPKDSTSYAGLASPTQYDIPMRPVSPQPSTSYAATAAMPASPRRSPPPAAPPRSPQPAPTDPSQPAPRSAYPPLVVLVVECLPNWTRHFQALNRVLGHSPNARPLGRGVRFLPKSADEFRAVQRYLTEAAAQDSTISWYCYSPATEVPTKVAIRGLPLETPIEEVVTALCALGFPAEAARAIPPPRGKHGCTYYVRLAHLTQEELRNLYATTDLLCMPQITVEAWRGGSKPPQCFRCQAYNHSSARCFRPIRCVRCAGEHHVRDCPRPRDEPPTCANCGQSHAANDRRCAYYRREARRRGIAQPPPPPRVPIRRQQQQRRATAAPVQSNAPATAPTRGNAQPHTAATQGATAPAATDTLPATVAPSNIDATRVLPTTRSSAPTEAPRNPTSLVADANPPTERGRAVRGRRRRNRAPRPVRSEPAAASTPHPRQTRMAPAYAHPVTSGAMHAATTTETPAANTEQTRSQRFAPQEGQAPAPSAGRSTTTSRPPVPPNQAPPSVPPAEQRAQGEVRPNPDIMAIVRVVVEALMTGLTAYLQGQGAILAITAGMAVLTRIHYC